MKLENIKALFLTDGTEVSIDSDLMTIHNNFGETWKVERSDWLFQFAEFVNEIAADIEDGASYQASYEATFDDESLEQQANEVTQKYLFMSQSFAKAPLKFLLD